MLTLMATESPRGNDGGFRRQVTFRIGAEDASFLDAAAREHGGIQSGILAALRAYAAQRLQAAATPPVSEEEDVGARAEASAEKPKPRKRLAPRHKPAPLVPPPADDDLVELNVSEAGPILGLSPASLREKIKRGTHPGRVGSNGLYLAALRRSTLRESGAELSPRAVAEVLGLKPSTIKRRCKAGQYPNARNDDYAWKIPIGDVL